MQDDKSKTDRKLNVIIEHGDDRIDLERTAGRLEFRGNLDAAAVAKAIDMFAEVVVPRVADYMRGRAAVDEDEPACSCDHGMEGKADCPAHPPAPAAVPVAAIVRAWPTMAELARGEGGCGDEQCPSAGCRLVRLVRAIAELN